MTTDSKCRPPAQQGASSQQDKQPPPSGCSAASTGSSLIIQLPTTSHQQLGQSDLTSGACSRPPSVSAIRRPTPNQNHRDSRQSRSTNLTGVVQPSANLHHHRISNHRYQQSAAHAAIDHHLLASSVLTHGGEPNNESSGAGDESSPAGTPPPNYHEIPGIVPSYHGRTSGPPPAYEDVVNPNASPPSYQSLFGQVREARKSSNGLVDLLRQLFLVLIGTLGCTMIIGFLLLIPITMIFIGLFYMNECRAENIPSFLVIGGFVWIMKNILNCYNQFKKDSSIINRPPAPRRPPIAARGNQQTTTNEPSSVVVITPSELNGQQANSISPPSGEPATSVASSITNATITTATTIATTSTTTVTSSTRSSGANYQVRHPPMIGITSYKCESLLNYFLVVWFLAGCIVVYRIYEPDYENLLSVNYCNRTVYLYAFWLMTSAFIIMAVILSCLCCLMVSSFMSCSGGR